MRRLLNCPYRSQCCKAKEGNNRKISINVKWEQQKEYIRAQLSDNKTGKIYKRRKIDVEPVFGFLKANLRFNRFTVRGKFKAKNRNGFGFDGSKFKKIYAAYSCSLILREVKGLEFEKKLKFQSFFSLRGWFCPSLIFLCKMRPLTMRGMQKLL